MAPNLITPSIAAVGGGRPPDFSQHSFTINGAEFEYGDFTNRPPAFLIVAAVSWPVAMSMSGLLGLLDRTREPTGRTCPKGLGNTPIGAAAGVPHGRAGEGGPAEKLRAKAGRAVPHAGANGGDRDLTRT